MKMIDVAAGDGDEVPEGMRAFFEAHTEKGPGHVILVVVTDPRALSKAPLGKSGVFSRIDLAWEWAKKVEDEIEGSFATAFVPYVVDDPDAHTASNGDGTDRRH